jgi:hypothetical protein
LVSGAARVIAPIVESGMPGCLAAVIALLAAGICEANA